MNIYAIIILVAIVVDFVLEIISNRLNLKSLTKKLPDEFEDVYDEDTYAKSQEYTRTRTKFGFITGTFNLLLLLGFWFSGGFNWLDQWARGFDYGVIGTGLIFIGALVIAKSIISLPFSLYSTFVIEERFGFNKTDAKTFIADRLKGLALSVLIGGPLRAGIIAFFEYGGAWAWLYAWLAVTAFSLVMQYVAPTWIMPLFNKFEPLEDGELRQAIESYADKVDFPLQGIYVMDGSKRSSKSNAFFTGFGKNKRIALFDTLIENHTTEELVAVLAHEIGHVENRDATIGALRAAGSAGLLSMVLGDFSGGTLAVLVTEHLISTSYTREAEILADDFALEALHEAEVSSEGLASFFDYILGLEGGGPALPAYLNTHPPSQARADKSRAHAETQSKTSYVLTDAEWTALKAICD